MRTRVALFLSLASLAGLYGLRLLGMVLRVSGLSAVALSTAGTLLCFLLPALAGLFMLDGDQHRMIALRALSAQHMLCLAAAGALFIGPAALLAELPGAALRLCGVELAQTAASAPDSGLFLPMLLQSALLAPICEELFFRGYLMGAFARAGRGKAAAAAALLFAAAQFFPRGAALPGGYRVVGFFKVLFVQSAAVTPPSACSRSHRRAAAACSVSNPASLCRV